MKKTASLVLTLALLLSALGIVSVASEPEVVNLSTATTQEGKYTVEEKAIVFQNGGSFRLTGETNKRIIVLGDALTLTLDGVTISTPESSARGAFQLSSSLNLILAEGSKNKISSSFYALSKVYDYIDNSDCGTLSISGGGSLEFSGIVQLDNLTIEDSSVKISYSGTKDGYSLDISDNASNSLSLLGESRLTVTNGYAGASSAGAIRFANGSLLVSGDSVLKAVTGPAQYAHYPLAAIGADISVNGNGRMELTAGDNLSNGDYSYPTSALYFFNVNSPQSLSVSENGKLIAQGGSGGKAGKFGPAIAGWTDGGVNVTLSGSAELWAQGLTCGVSASGAVTVEGDAKLTALAENKDLGMESAALAVSDNALVKAQRIWARDSITVSGGTIMTIDGIMIKDDKPIAQGGGRILQVEDLDADPPAPLEEDGEESEPSELVKAHNAAVAAAKTEIGGMTAMLGEIAPVLDELRASSPEAFASLGGLSLPVAETDAAKRFEAAAKEIGLPLETVTADGTRVVAPVLELDARMMLNLPWKLSDAMSGQAMLVKLVTADGAFYLDVSCFPKSGANRVFWPIDEYVRLAAF